MMNLDEWPDQKSEEITVYCLINAYPLFQVESLGEPAVVIHRFGGTYGPARFLLKASTVVQEGVIKATLVNSWGVPVQILHLNGIQVTQEKVQQLQQVGTVRKRSISPAQEGPSVSPPISDVPETLSTIESYLSRIQEIENAWIRAKELSGLASRLPESLFPEALRIAMAIESDSARADALIALAPHLPENLRTTALAAAQAIQAEEHRTRTLKALSPAEESSGNQLTSSLIDFSPLIAAATRNFIGREQVFQAINDWLSAPRNARFFLVTGEPGIGKTAIASRLAQFSQGEVRPPHGLGNFYPGFLKAVHFCSAINSRSTDPREFSKSISLQLANLIPEYASILVELNNSQFDIQVELDVQLSQGSTIRSVSIESIALPSNISPQEAFDALLVEPINLLYRRGYKDSIIILVDALDESLRSSWNIEIIDLLSNLSALPLEVGFIITARPTKEIDRIKTLNQVEEYLVKSVSISLAKNIQFVFLPLQEAELSANSLPAAVFAIQDDALNAVKEAFDELAQGWLKLVSMRKPPDNINSGLITKFISIRRVNT
jgi:hypothetical protein